MSKHRSEAFRCHGGQTHAVRLHQCLVRLTTRGGQRARSTSPRWARHGPHQLVLKKVRHTAQLTRLTVLPVKRSYDDSTAQQSQLNTHLPMLHATLSKPTERSLVRAGLSAAIICLSSARSYQSRLSTPAWGTKVTLRAACLP